MNSEEQELIEIEKMLERINETSPPPQLRGETLNRARQAWQAGRSYSYNHLLTLAAAAIILFSIGYIVGISKKDKTEIDVEPAGKIKKFEIDKKKDEGKKK